MYKHIMFYSVDNPGGSHRVCEVDGDYQHPGGAAKRVCELGGGWNRIWRMYDV